jgi:hypothetical protein
MNADKERALVELTQRSPFWICLVVFLALACDHGFRLVTQFDQQTQLKDQRVQLEQAKTMQDQNQAVLYDAQQLEARLQSLSLDLLQIAKTNAPARQIVQDFNIQWNPGPAAAPAQTNAPTPPAASAVK